MVKQSNGGFQTPSHVVSYINSLAMQLGVAPRFEDSTIISTIDFEDSTVNLDPYFEDSTLNLDYGILYNEVINSLTSEARDQLNLAGAFQEDFSEDEWDWLLFLYLDTVYLEGFPPEIIESDEPPTPGLSLPESVDPQNPPRRKS
jgi:hypothetical protein